MLVAALALVSAPSRNSVPKLWEVLASHLRLPRLREFTWLAFAQTTELAGHFTARRPLPCESSGRGSQERSSVIWPVTNLPGRVCLNVPALGSNVESPRGLLISSVATLLDRIPGKRRFESPPAEEEVQLSGMENRIARSE